MGNNSDDDFFQNIPIAGKEPEATQQGQEQANLARRRLTLAEAFELQPPGWIIKGLLLQKGIGQIFGPSYTGKSLLAVSLALAVSLGTDWFGFKVKKRPVLYIPVEDLHGIIAMFKALSVYHGMTPVDLCQAHLRIDRDPLNLGDPDYVELLKNGLPKGCLIIIDTQSAASWGLDENSSKDMGLLIQAARELAASCEGFVLLVSHTGKEESRGARGHSSQFAAWYLSIKVEYADSNGFYKWTADKVKGSKRTDPYPYRIESVLLGYDEDGDPVTAAIALFDEEEKERLGQEKKQVRKQHPFGLRGNKLIAFKAFMLAKGDKDAVGYKEWRDVFFAIATQDNDKAKKQAFSTTRKELVVMNILTVNNDVYSIHKDRLEDGGEELLAEYWQSIKDELPPACGLENAMEDQADNAAGKEQGTTKDDKPVAQNSESTNTAGKE